MAGLPDTALSRRGAQPRASRTSAHLPFTDRRAAGRELAARLERYAGRADVLVLGLARGGVPVAAEIADALGAPLDVFVVRKLGVPGREELAFGAVASGGARALNDSVVQCCGIPEPDVEAITALARREVGRLEEDCRDGVPAVSPAGRTVIVADDGLATGATMRVAIAALRDLGPAAIVAASPLAPAGACARLREVADAVVCAATPDPFNAVGAWYEDFAPVATDEVHRLLRRSRHEPVEQEHRRR